MTLFRYHMCYNFNVKYMQGIIMEARGVFEVIDLDQSVFRNLPIQRL